MPMSREPSQGRLRIAACLIGAFVGGALFTHTVSVMLSHGAVSIPPAKASTTYARISSGSGGTQCSTLSRSSSITLPQVGAHEIEAAVAELDLSGDEQRSLMLQLTRGTKRLLWLTIWDWDTQNADGDTVEIRSGTYTRRVKLAATHQRIAIPEPWSGYIEIEGQETSDGVVAVSLLNGAEPLAIPRMRLGEKIKLALDELRH
jgi:hypothetical protein